MPEKKKRPSPRRVRVEEIERLTPRVVSIRFAGEDLKQFNEPRPGAHIKLIFADEAAFEDPSRLFEPGKPRPTARTYTPRRFDRNAGTIDVEFVLHGDGVASNWAKKARVGDPLLLAGPGGGFEFPADLSHLVIAADSCAVPAAGTLLDALPASTRATLLVEVEDASEERSISAHPRPAQWIHQDPLAPCSRLENAITTLAIEDPKLNFWIACEARTVRQIRKTLLSEHRIPVERIHTRGYWFTGATDYPDGDYGDGEPKVRSGAS